MRHFLITSFILFSVSTPIVAGASSIGRTPQDIGQLAQLILDILSLFVPLLIGLALVVFLWGVFRYVVAEGAEDKNKARDTIIYGLIGLFVMVAVWGLVAILTGTFGLSATIPSSGGNSDPFNIPLIET